MSPPWSVLLDIDRLADSQADIDFTLPLDELAALRSQFPQLAGSISGKVKLERVQGIPVAELALAGTAQLICQRCLGPLELPVASHVRVGLIATEAQLTQVPEDLEPVLAPNGRTSIAALVTEELLLSLPIVPQHERAEECVASQEQLADGEQAPPTQKPFARLGELLNRK